MLIIENIFRSLSNAKSRGSAHVYLARKVGKFWRYSSWEKGNFITINKFKYGQNWKIWPSPLSLSLYSTFKNCTGSILKVSTFSWHLLIANSFLTLLWIYSLLISLSGDIEQNPGPKWDDNQCFSVYHWNLNSIASDFFSKSQSLIAHNWMHKFKIICLSESYLNSEISSSDSILQMPGYNFARMDHPCVSLLQMFIAAESHRLISSSRIY